MPDAKLELEWAKILAESLKGEADFASDCTLGKNTKFSKLLKNAHQVTTTRKLYYYKLVG